MSSKKHKPGSIILREHKRVQPEAVTASAIQLYLESLDCPRSLAVWLMFSNKEHAQLVSLEFNPLDYQGLDAVRNAYAATKFLSKFEGLSLDQDKELVAYQKFDEFELLCRSTNTRFKSLQKDPLYRGPAVWLHNAVTRKICNILEPTMFLPNGRPIEVSVFRQSLELADWGPGATTLMTSRVASNANKFQYESGITRDCFTLFNLEAIQEFYPGWHRILSQGGFPAFQVGNKVITVPKDAKTDRVIAIEPGLNIWVQLGLGSVLSKCLRKFGVDLRDQSKNQEMARIGSLTGAYATIDLSSASDSIALEVVREIIPPDWFEVLDACRSQYGYLRKELVKWEKFSSMGNGFTFPLESLIFYAIASCCIEYIGLKDRAYVYGDDVIIPVQCVDLFSMMCDFYGFRINVKKSHYSSPFRESCGAHYYGGIDVKPLYLEGKLTTVPTVYRLANAVRRMAHRRNSSLGCDSAFFPLFRFLVSLVPKPIRLWVPETLGDGGFISNFDEAVPSRARNGIEGYYVQHLTEVAVGHEVDFDGLLQAHLCGTFVEGVQALDPLKSQAGLRRFIQLTQSSQKEARSSKSDRPRPCIGNLIYVRGHTRLRLNRSLVPRWYSLGPWI